MIIPDYFHWSIEKRENPTAKLCTMRTPRVFQRLVNVCDKEEACVVVLFADYYWLPSSGRVRKEKKKERGLKEKEEGGCPARRRNRLRATPHRFSDAHFYSYHRRKTKRQPTKERKIQLLICLPIVQVPIWPLCPLIIVVIVNYFFFFSSFLFIFQTKKKRS